MKTTGIQNTLIPALLVLSMSIAFVAYADEANVSNTINVSSSSGGNTASGGNASGGSSGESSVVEGEEHSTVDIETEVNGETVESVHKESTDGLLEVETHVATDSIETDITTNADTKLHEDSPRVTAHEDSPRVTEEQAVAVETETESTTTVEVADNTAHTNIFVRIVAKVTTFFSHVFSLFG